MQEQIKENENRNATSELVVRREKLAALREAGNDPFVITKFEVNSDSAAVKAGFTDEGEQKTVTVAGRMVSRRVMGKASFVHLQDDSGKIQLYVRREDVGEDVYAGFKKWDVGDIIGVTGFVFRTQTGEISIHAESLTLLAKSLLPLPEKFHGLTNTDLRYRQRYVDMIVNPEVKDTFVKRSKILKEIRAYLDGRGFLEVTFT